MCEMLNPMLRQRGGGCNGSKATLEFDEPTTIEPRQEEEEEEVGRADRSITVVTIATLDTLEAELSSMEAKSNSAAAAIASASAIPLGLRSELASLHGMANKLLATRLDAVQTTELSPDGREKARAQRKRLVLAAGARRLCAPPLPTRVPRCR